MLYLACDQSEYSDIFTTKNLDANCKSLYLKRILVLTDDAHTCLWK